MSEAVQKRQSNLEHKLSMVQHVSVIWKLWTLSMKVF